MSFPLGHCDIQCLPHSAICPARLKGSGEQESCLLSWQLLHQHLPRCPAQHTLTIYRVTKLTPADAKQVPTEHMGIVSKDIHAMGFFVNSSPLASPSYKGINKGGSRAA